jgi:hypothetical protein
MMMITRTDIRSPYPYFHLQHYTCSYVHIRQPFKTAKCHEILQKTGHRHFLKYDEESVSILTHSLTIPLLDRFKFIV